MPGSNNNSTYEDVFNNNQEEQTTQSNQGQMPTEPKAQFYLSSELRKSLSEIEINPSKNMLDGKVTSAYSGEENNNVSSSLRTQLTNQVVTEASSYIMGSLTSYISESIANIMSLSFMGELPGIVTSYTAYYTKPLPEILKELNAGPIDKQTEKEEKENEEKEKKGFTDKLSYTANKLKKEGDKIQGLIDKKVKSITAYITAGPDAIENRVRKVSDEIISNNVKEFGRRSQEIDKAKHKWVQNTGEKLGKSTANVLNKKTQRAQKKLQEKKERTIQSNLNKVLAQAQALIMKLIGLLGA
jgi:hypothetical protein